MHGGRGTGADGGPTGDVEVVREHERSTTAQSSLVEYARRLGPDPTLADLDDEELVRQVRTGAAALAAATCRWLTLLGELVVRGAWAADGASSPAAWLSWALGIGESTGREHVRVALRLRECPEVRERFAAGTLSYSKARAITRATTPATEAMLVRWSDHMTAAELERVVRDSRRLQAAEAGPAVGDDLGVTARWRDDGSYEVVLRVDAATGIEVEQQLDRLAEVTLTAAMAEAIDTEAARPTRRERLGEALVGALAAAVAAAPEDTSGADRHLAVVELSAATYLAAAATNHDMTTDAPDPSSVASARASAEADTTADTSAGTSAEASAAAVDTPELPAGASAEADTRAVLVGSGRGRGRTRPVPLRQLGRLTCGARIDLHVHDDGHPGDLGTTRRLPDAKLRRLLLARDRSCRFPGCGATRFLHAHHVQPWDDGGPTNLDNLVTLCGHHHRFIHARGWTLRPAGRGRWTFHPGADQPAHPATAPPAAATDSALLTSLLAHADRADPHALTPALRDGFGYDRDLTVGVLLDRLTPEPVAA